MQDLLAASLELVAVSFALIIAFDFINGLVHLYCASAPSVESQPEQALAPHTEPASIALSIQPEPQQQVILGWDLIEPVSPEVATLSWIEQNMPPTEMWVAEIPDAISLCKARQPQVQPVVPLATHQQLVSAGIRKCKKLASSLHVYRYNTMRLAELADILEGKVTAAELVA